jgi:xylose dehydrogenase (NAD/NADP)
MKKRSVLRWGLLSTARINRRLIPAIRAARRCELFAVASRDMERAQRYAAEWGVPRAYGSYQALLDDPDLDAVYIALPNALHAEWTIRAARAGKHVLCEKPLAVSVAEVDQIGAAATASGVVVMEAIMYLYHPLLHKVRGIVREGALGEVSLVRSSFSVFLDQPADVRWDPALGGGSLWDLGIYPVSLIRWIAGEPVQVFGWQRLSATGVDETFAGLLHCPGDLLGAFDCSFRQQFRNNAEIAGTAATLIIEQPYGPSPEKVVLRGQDGEETVLLAEADAYHSEVEALVAAALDGEPPAVPLESSAANIAALAALYQSARQGAPVQLGSPRQP